MGWRNANRRQFLQGAAAAAFAARSSARPSKASSRIARFQTAYKWDQLVLSASGEPGRFDSEKVDSPFVFRHGRHFYMTFVGFDGTGYQTGIAQSDDLINWSNR